MTADGSLSELYQALILDHNAKPRNFGPFPEATHHAEGHNPLCGDRLSIHVRVVDDTIAEVRFEGSGCAISKASASLMTGALKGKTVAEARNLFERFHGLVTSDQEASDAAGSLGKLSVFAGVREFPMRVKCATLSWHTVNQALDDQPSQGPATTE